MEAFLFIYIGTVYHSKPKFAIPCEFVPTGDKIISSEENLCTLYAKFEFG